MENQYAVVLAQLNLDLLKMPNTALHPDVPIGKDSEENVVVKSVGLASCLSLVLRCKTISH